jgi:hypothetical protein
MAGLAWGTGFFSYGLIKAFSSQAQVAHASNPSYSGGRDQEDCGSKPVRANSSRDPILKIPITKRAGGETQGEGPEFKSQYCKKKREKLSPCKSISLHTCSMLFLTLSFGLILLIMPFV